MVETDMSERRMPYRARRGRTTGAESMHLLAAEARKEALEARGAYTPAVLHEDITHAEFQRLAVDALVACGYRVFYQPDSRMSPSGMVDLIALNPTATYPLLWIEIKVQGDALRSAQQLWRGDLLAIRATYVLLVPSFWTGFIELIDDGHVERGRALLKGVDPNNGTS